MSPPIRATEVSSPCVRTCCLDDDDICIGCGRALSEIVAWGTADDTTRRAILERSRDRVGRRTQKQGSTG